VVSSGVHTVPDIPPRAVLEVRSSRRIGRAHEIPRRPNTDIWLLSIHRRASLASVGTSIVHITSPTLPPGIGGTLTGCGSASIAGHVERNELVPGRGEGRGGTGGGGRGRGAGRGKRVVPE
jgi:hypothetical protein